MIQTPLFQNGIETLLRVRWTLKLETPLCIKSGYTSAFNPTGNGKKVRYENMTYQWQPPKTDKPKTDENVVEVQELRSGLEVVNGTLRPYHTVPASAVRGALRSWSLKRLVKNDRHINLLNLEENDQDGKLDLISALQNDAELALIADMFGVAAGKDNDRAETVSRSGRMRLETAPIKPDSQSVKPWPWVQGNDWKGDSNDFGPCNINRHISVRGPVDRITQGAMEGGLHYFMEFSPGQTFEVDMKCVNPRRYHIGLYHLWQREINNGLLRFGGLSAVGRGRMKVVEAHAQIFALPGYEPDWLVKATPESPASSDDVLA